MNAAFLVEPPTFDRNEDHLALMVYFLNSAKSIFLPSSVLFQSTLPLYFHFQSVYSLICQLPCFEYHPCYSTLLSWSFWAICLYLWAAMGRCQGAISQAKVNLVWKLLVSFFKYLIRLNVCRSIEKHNKLGALGTRCTIIVVLKQNASAGIQYCAQIPIVFDLMCKANNTVLARHQGWSKLTIHMRSRALGSQFMICSFEQDHLSNLHFPC